MKKNYSTSIFWLAVVALAVIGYMMYSVQNITRASYVKNEGLVIELNEDAPNIETIPLDIITQTNSKWAMQEMFEDKKLRICTHGSQIVCTASVLRLFGVNRTPLELYNEFLKVELFSPDESDPFCNVSYEFLYYKYKLLYESPMLHNEALFDADTITSLLADGTPVMVRTKHPLIDRFWVVIIGVSDGEFIIMDPMSNEYGTLSTYDNKIYEMVYFTSE